MRTVLRAAFVVAFATLLTSTALAQKSRWVETHSWKGVGTGHTPKFLVNGSKWRVRYRPEGKGAFAIVLYDAQGQVKSTVARQSGPYALNGSRTLRGSGMHYLGIHGTPTRWEIVVEQYLSVIEEWHLGQFIRTKVTDFGKLGSWSGEALESEYEVVIPYGSWQLVQNVPLNGSLAVTITSEDGGLVAATMLNRPGEHVTWGNGSGSFVMSIKATGADWSIELFGDQTDLPAPHAEPAGYGRE